MLWNSVCFKTIKCRTSYNLQHSQTTSLGFKVICVCSILFANLFTKRYLDQLIYSSIKKTCVVKWNPVYPHSTVSSETDSLTNVWFIKSGVWSIVSQCMERPPAITVINQKTNSNNCYNKTKLANLSSSVAGPKLLISSPRELNCAQKVEPFLCLLKSYLLPNFSNILLHVKWHRAVV